MVVRVSIETLENRLLFVGTISEQIIVDQFGWRADAPKKVALFADPKNGGAIPDGLRRCGEQQQDGREAESHRNQVGQSPAALRRAALMRSCQPGPSSWK